MQGFLITFFTQQDRMHGDRPLAQWLVEEARRLGVRGATLSGAIEGLGHDGAIHAITMFDLSDQPVQAMLALSADEADRFFARLEQEKVRVFYTKVAAEFGVLDGGK